MQAKKVPITGAGGFFGHHLAKYLVEREGVRERNSDNTRLRQVLGWEPAVSLEEGLGRTYSWIAEQLRLAAACPEAAALSA